MSDVFRSFGILFLGIALVMILAFSGLFGLGSMAGFTPGQVRDIYMQEVREDLGR